MVNVPKMNELSAKRLVGDVEGDELICQYLPDLSGGKYINRQYMFNVRFYLTQLLVDYQYS